MTSVARAADRLLRGKPSSALGGGSALSRSADSCSALSRSASAAAGVGSAAVQRQAEEAAEAEAAGEAAAEAAAELAELYATLKGRRVRVRLVSARLRASCKELVPAWTGAVITEASLSERRVKLRYGPSMRSEAL
jgi:hypothetical protein